ncbi:hypothetical protein EDB19DRAFT_2025712 [Suillus lakei]|nr:hypothetical protein EDB19DRAFT_2025712 [Suillus lakei]
MHCFPSLSLKTPSLFFLTQCFLFRTISLKISCTSPHLQLRAHRHGPELWAIHKRIPVEIFTVSTHTNKYCPSLNPPQPLISNSKPAYTPTNLSTCSFPTSTPWSNLLEMLATIDFSYYVPDAVSASQLHREVHPSLSQSRQPDIKQQMFDSALSLVLVPACLFLGASVSSIGTTLLCLVCDYDMLECPTTLEAVSVSQLHQEVHPSLSRSRHHVHNLTSSSRSSTPALSLVLVFACLFLVALISSIGTIHLCLYPWIPAKSTDYPEALGLGYRNGAETCFSSKLAHDLHSTILNGTPVTILKVFVFVPNTCFRFIENKRHALPQALTPQLIKKKDRWSSWYYNESIAQTHVCLKPLRNTE